VRDKERLIRILIFGVIVQISLGLSQIVGGVPLRDFLGARNTTSELAGFKADFTGTRFEDVNNLMGTMGNTIDYGAFLLVGVALFLCVVPQRRRVARLIGISMSLLCIFLTNSRSAIIASVVILFVYTYMEHGRRRALVLGTMVATCLSVVLLVLPIYQSSGDINSQYSSRTRFFDMFTSDYVQEAMNQRLGLVVYVVPDFFADVSSVAFGYTPDPKVYLVAAQKRFPHIPDSLLLDLAGIIEDVYWLALMIYFGVIGFALFAGAIAWAIHALARAYRKEIAPDRRRFILFALLLMVSSIPLNCFNQVFLMRQFSLCLWTTFALALSTQKEEFHAYSSST